MYYFFILISISFWQANRTMDGGGGQNNDGDGDEEFHPLLLSGSGDSQWVFVTVLYYAYYAVLIWSNRAFGLALHGVCHSKTPRHFGVLDWSCTPITGVQSASSSGVPYCTPWDSTPVARVPKWIAALGFNTPRPNSHSCVKSEWSIRFKQSNPVFKAKFGLECWLKNGL